METINLSNFMNDAFSFINFYLLQKQIRIQIKDNVIFSTFMTLNMQIS